MRRNSIYILLLSLVMSLSACYNHKPKAKDLIIHYSAKQLDSLSFSSTHHYTNNYNFIVKADSITLIKQQPEEVINKMKTDSFAIHKHDHIVVMDIRVLPKDSIDSVWVQVAHNQNVVGWLHESRLTQNVVPDDPISQFIAVFSNIHTLIFLIIICIISAIYLLYKNQQHNAPIVHFRDIDSFYPTLLALIVALSATLYAGIQMFAPNVWQQFYYHPTLNPFSVPVILAIFLTSIWAIIIVSIAVIDDVRHLLSFTDAVMYLSGLAAVCAVNYIVFSITTLYYIGYLLLIAYIYWALKIYFGTHNHNYICGNCGKTIHQKGKCPYCGAINK